MVLERLISSTATTSHHTEAFGLSSKGSLDSSVSFHPVLAIFVMKHLRPFLAWTNIFIVTLGMSVSFVLGMR